jgi:dTDP-glucose pyrophosphorylase/predicted transcriptional regulator
MKIKYFKLAEIKENILFESATIKECTCALNVNNLHIVFIIDANHNLIGTVTDGDIRRSIVSGHSLEESVVYVMNNKFLSMPKNSNEFEVAALMNQSLVRQIPILDGKKLLGIYAEVNDNFALTSEYVMVIMAGGKGTRLEDLTFNTPKPMVNVKGTPILEILILGAIEAGFRKFYLSVYYLKDQIKNYFGNGKNYGVDIEYLEECQPLGTAGSLGLLPREIKRPIVVINADVLTKINYEDFLLFHQQNSADITIGVRENIIDIPYGVLSLDGVLVNSIEEKPTIKSFIISGIYIINSEVVDKVSFQGHIDMPNFLLKCLDLGLKVIAFPIHEYWIDIGRKETLKKANDEWITGSK